MEQGMNTFLLKENYCPIVQRGAGIHDLSSEFVDKCVYVSEPNIMVILAAMRSCDCVLDVFNEISRLSSIARVPFVACDDRKRYVGTKEYEFDDLCCFGIPHEYIFSLPAIITDGDNAMWQQNIFDCIDVRIKKVTKYDRNSWPPTSEINELVSYSKVRRIKSKHFGTRYIKINRI